jgi:vesicle-fusing ATPase
MLNEKFVLTAVPFEGFPRGSISLSDPQRTWAQISLQDVVQARIYDPFSEGGDRYLGTLDVEIGFAGRKTTAEQLDQDELAGIFVQVCY